MIFGNCSPKRRHRLIRRANSFTGSISASRILQLRQELLQAALSAVGTPVGGAAATNAGGRGCQVFAGLSRKASAALHRAVPGIAPVRSKSVLLRRPRTPQG